MISTEVTATRQRVTNDKNKTTVIKYEYNIDISRYYITNVDDRKIQTTVQS